MEHGEITDTTNYAMAQKAETLALHRDRIEQQEPLKGRVTSSLNRVGGVALLGDIAVAPTIQENDEMLDGWKKDAKCRGISDASIFFPLNPRDATMAKAICKGCPVRQECLEYAVELKEYHGVWGGASERERRQIIRQRTDRSQAKG